MATGLIRASALVVVLVLGLVACRDDAIGDREAFCAGLERMPTIAADDDLDAAVVDEVEASLNELRSVAPSAVRDEVATMHEVVVELRAVMTERELGGSGDVEADFRSRRGAYALASDKVVAYAADECGLELEP